MYHFSQESDCFAKEQIKNFVTSMREKLEGMGFKVDDQQREYRAEGLFHLFIIIMVFPFF